MGEFSSSCKYMNPKQLKLKLEHQGKHATIGLDITIEDNIFVDNLFDKRDKFPFFLVCMPYLSRNNSLSVFYGSIFLEFLRIARCTPRLANFVSTASKLYVSSNDNYNAL